MQALKVIERIIFYLLFIMPVILFFKSCHGGFNGGGQNDTVRTEVIFKYDTTIHTIATQNIYHYSSDTVFLPTKIDTGEVVKDYFRKYAYCDTIQDTNLIVYVNDTIFKNSIFSRRFSYKLLRPTQIITNTIIDQPHRKVFIGAFGAEYSKTFFGGGELMLVDKKERYWGIGYDPFNKYFLARVGIKVRL